MPKDVRVSGLQANQIIASGSSTTNAKLVVYGVQHQSPSQPNEGIINPNSFPTASIGTDVFLYVSGGIAADNTTFGGDVHISGNLVVDGTSVVGIPQYFHSITADLAATSGSVAISGSLLVKSGITGALNLVAPGVPFLNAGTAITLSTASNGQVTISATPGATTAAGGENEIQYNASSLLTASNALWFGNARLSVTGTVQASLGFTGSLTRTVNGTNFIVGTSGLTTSTGSAGQVTISAQPLSSSVVNDVANLNTTITTLSGAVASDVSTLGGRITALSGATAADIIANRDKLYWNSTTNGLIFTTGSVEATGSLLVKSGITGALNLISAGVPFLVSAGGLALSTASNGQITVSTTTLSTSIATDIIANRDKLYWNSTTNGSIFTTGSMSATGSLLVKSGITGALNLVAAGIPFMVSAGGLALSTGSNGQITVSTTALSTSIETDILALRNRAFFHSITAGLAATTGSIAASGSLLIKSGITGALNNLPDGTSFLVGGGGLTTSTGSNGQITVSAATLSSSIATDILANTNKITFVSNSLFFPPNVVDSSGDRTLTNNDSGTVIFMSGSTNRVRVPLALNNGFNVTLAQVTTTQILVLASASLKYPTTFLSRSAAQNSMVVLYSGSSGLFMGGDMELA